MMGMAEGVGVEQMKGPEGDGGDGGNSTAPREKRKLGPFAAVTFPSKKSNEATKRLLASGLCSAGARARKRTRTRGRPS